jgi:hypothetical protein
MWAYIVAERIRTLVSPSPPPPPQNLLHILFGHFNSLETLSPCFSKMLCNITAFYNYMSRGGLLAYDSNTTHNFAYSFIFTMPRIYLLNSVTVRLPGTSYVLIHFVIFSNSLSLLSYDIQINDAATAAEITVLQLHLRMFISGKKERI